MKGSSKRLLAGVAGVFLLVLAGTAGILISNKKPEKYFWRFGNLLVTGRRKNPGNRPGEGGNHNSENKGRKRNSAGLFQRVCYGRYYPELV